MRSYHFLRDDMRTAAEHKPRLLPCPFCGIVGVHKCEGEWQVDNCQHNHYNSLGTIPAKTKITYSCGHEGCDAHRVVEQIPQQARRRCLTCGAEFKVPAGNTIRFLDSRVLNCTERNVVR